MLLLGTFFSIVLGLVTGVVAAWRRGTLLEKLSVWIGLAFFSLPTQWLAHHADPLHRGAARPADARHQRPVPLVHATRASGTEFTDRLSHMVLPSLTLGLVLYGEYTLIARSALLETFGEDYVLTARAKGLTTWQVVRKHALRNSLLPITTLDLPLARLHRGRLDPDRGGLQLPGHRAARLPERVPEGLPDAAGRVPDHHGVDRDREPDRRPAVRHASTRGSSNERARSTRRPRASSSRPRRGLRDNAVVVAVLGARQALFGGIVLGDRHPDRRARSVDRALRRARAGRRRVRAPVRPRTGSGSTTAASTWSA